MGGETPLHIAAAGGYTDIVASLLLAKACPDVQDVDGESPLHYAAMAGQPHTARVLLRAGAQASVESFFMETAYRVAQQNVASVFGVDTSGVANLLTKDVGWRDAMIRTLDVGRTLSVKAGNTVPPEVLQIFEKCQTATDETMAVDDLMKIFRSINADLPVQDLVRHLVAVEPKMGAAAERIKYKDFLTALYDGQAADDLPL